MKGLDDSARQQPVSRKDSIDYLFLRNVSADAKGILICHKAPAAVYCFVVLHLRIRIALSVTYGVLLLPLVYCLLMQICRFIS